MKKSKSKSKTLRSQVLQKGAPSKSAASKHPYLAHTDRIRTLVQSELAQSGINNLSLRSMEFSPAQECPDGQHLERVCTTDASGTETCVWKCVSN
jgi:hypothetical protein